MRALLKLSELSRTGAADMKRLKRTRDRDETARLVRALRRWHGEIIRTAEDYSGPLAQALWDQNPRNYEYARVAGEYPSLAQARLLMTTATALYRLAPHLANAKPVRKTGPKPRRAPEALAEFHRLRVLPDPPSKNEAAHRAVAKYGKGTHATPGAAATAVRKDYLV